jgi:hypothetical protein
MIRYLSRALTATWWAIYDVLLIGWRILFAAVYGRGWPY